MGSVWQVSGSGFALCMVNYPLKQQPVPLQWPGRTPDFITIRYATDLSAYLPSLLKPNYRSSKIKNAMYKPLLTIATIAAVLGVTGCGDNAIKQAANFSPLSTELKSSNVKLAADYYDSCRRRLLWDPNVEPITDTSCEYKDRPFADRLQKAGQVLIGYYAALGKLAGLSTPDGIDKSYAGIGESINTLSTSVSGETVFKEPMIKAGSSLAASVTDYLTRSSKYASIKRAVVCSDSAVREYTDALITIWEDTYLGPKDRPFSGKLPEEQRAIYRYYENPVLEIVRRTNSEDDRLKLETQRRAALVNINTQRKTALDFKQNLQTAASFHHEMFRIFAPQYANKGLRVSCPPQTGSSNIVVSNLTDKNVPNKTTLIRRKISLAERQELAELVKRYLDKVNIH